MQISIGLKKLKEQRVMREFVNSTWRPGAYIKSEKEKEMRYCS